MFDLVSVCVPVYGVSRYIERCVRSLFEQTYPEVEYVFVDDCSPDDSMAILARVADDYPGRSERIKIVRHETNRGRAAARRAATMQAAGAWLIHCDPDDWLEGDYLERLLQAAKSCDADLSYGPIRREWPDGSFRCVPVVSCQSGREMTARLCPGDGFNSMVNKLIRTSIAQARELVWLDGINLGEDLLFTGQVLPHCHRIAYCPEAVYHYRQNPSSITAAGNLVKRVDDLAAVADVLVSVLSAPDYRAVRDRLRRDVLTAMLKARQFDRACWKRYRDALESSLLSDSRHGLLKKGALFLANCLLD